MSECVCVCVRKCVNDYLHVAMADLSSTLLIRVLQPCFLFISEVCLYVCGDESLRKGAYSF